MPASLKRILPLAAVLLGTGAVLFLAVRQPGSPDAAGNVGTGTGTSTTAPLPMEPASFRTQAAVLKLSENSPAPLEMGLLGLGSILELDLTLQPEGAGGLSEVESSCSCLQPLSQPGAFAEGQPQRLRARYMAVRPGPVDVTLAFGRKGADGKEQILSARVTGIVGAGDAALADRLAEMVKSPLPPRLAQDETGVVTAAEARREVEAGTGVLVDIRGSEEFSRSHITGALNIPAAQLKPSGAFRGRDLYLTGPSLTTLSLLEARRGMMRRSGGGHASAVSAAGAAGNGSAASPQIFVVADGVTGWKAAGGAVFQEIDPAPVLGALTALELREALAAAASDHVTVLGIEPADEFAFRYYFPGGQPVKAGDLSAAVEAALNKASAAGTAGAGAGRGRVVIVDGRGDHFGEVNLTASAAWLGRVSYLRESFEAYRGGVDQQGLLASRVPGESGGSAKGFVRRTPGQRVGVPASPGSPGCGTCPKK